MKKLIFIFLVSFKAFSQISYPVFEFDHTFIDEIPLFKDLTKEKHQDLRKYYRIKSIKINVTGNSLDSTYLKDIKVFRATIDLNILGHSSYSYFENYNYDNNGILISNYKYPISKYLTKEDSSKTNQLTTKYITNNDSTHVLTFFKDTLREKSCFNKGKLIYNIKIDRDYKTEEVSPNNFVSNYKGMKTIKTQYEYFNDGKIRKKITDNKVDLEYEYINTNRIIVTNYSFNIIDNKDCIYQKVIIKDNEDKISEVIFYEKNKPEHTSTYKVYYDKIGNVHKITRRNKYEGAFDEKDTFYKFENFYKDKKLIKTKVHCNFNEFDNNITYLYNEQGLIKCIDYGSQKHWYDYIFYPN